MGIERFFSSISTNSVTNLTESFNKTQTEELDITHLYIDFNSIIHTSSARVLSELNLLLYRGLVDERDDKKFHKLTEKYHIDPKMNFASMVKKFDEEFVDTYVVKEVVRYVYKILEEYIVSESLESLYIAIDGVPSKSKMITQKQRRYMGEVISGIKKLIFKQYEKDLKKDKIRHTFEANRVSWSRNKISPGTPFMDAIHREFHYNKKFNERIKEICKNLKEYVYSSLYIHGEGEMKIVRWMREMKNTKGRFMVYSPDSDVISLCLLLNIPETPINKQRFRNLVMLRHNQQKGNYDIINIDKLTNNIVTFVKAHINNPRIQPDEYNIISDVVFIFTIFGNDFLPRIESYNVSHDFTRIIKKYTGLLNSTGKYMIGFDRKSNQKVINYPVFLEFMKILQINEGGNLQNVYLSTHFRNYNRLKKIMKVESDNFIKEMNEFGELIRGFHADINSSRKVEEVVTAWGDNKNSDFFMILRMLTNFSAQSTNEYIIKYYTYVKRSGKFPRIKLDLEGYDRSLGDKYHQDKLMEKFRNYSRFTTTKYDEEIYKLDNMLDEYVDKLNHKDIELGKLYMTDDYMWKSEKITEGVSRYYSEYFGIKDINVKNQRMKKLLDDYLLGFVWVFEYYFNQHIITDTAISRWSYNYLRSPLLSQLYYHLRDSKNPNILLEYRARVYQSYMDTQSYFNNVEHLLYVSPCKQMLSSVPKEYHDFIKKDSRYYPDLDTSIQNIWKMRRNNDIDCRGVIFLNKCYLNTLGTRFSDKAFLDDVRAIKMSKETDKFAGRFIADKTLYENKYHDSIKLKDLK